MSKGKRLRARVIKNERINLTSGLIKRATKHLESLQRQLFRAISECRLRKPIRFGMLIKNRYFNKLLSLWKVAHLNKGKKTAGVDQMKIQLTDPRQLSKIKDKLERDLNHDKWKPLPVRRVMIPKPDGTSRPLGIPTQDDRVVQGILNRVLEVTVEHEIYHNQLGSYGFRKYHSTADAVNNLSAYAWQGKHAMAIEADISKCFDQITHEFINHLLTGNVIAKQVEKLLKAGPVEIDGLLVTNHEGTPPGGVISPTISNLVLREILDKPLARTPKKVFGANIFAINLTTYADDLVIIITPSNAGKINQANWQKQVSDKMLDWLKPQLSLAGLELKATKTRVITDDTPFDFWGSEIQRGKGIRVKKDMVKKLRVKVKSKLRKGRKQQRVLTEINPILRGIYNYAATFSSGKMWKQIGKIEVDIAKRLQKLYKTYDIGPVKFTDVPKTTKYIAVKKGATWLLEKPYWDKRNLTMLTPRKKHLYKQQEGICPIGKGKFTLNENEVLETHHLKATGKGGQDQNSKVALLHSQCHQAVHEQDRQTRELNLINNWFIK